MARSGSLGAAFFRSWWPDLVGAQAKPFYSPSLSASSCSQKRESLLFFAFRTFYWATASAFVRNPSLHAVPRRPLREELIAACPYHLFEAAAVPDSPLQRWDSGRSFGITLALASTGPRRVCRRSKSPKNFSARSVASRVVFSWAVGWVGVGGRSAGIFILFCVMLGQWSGPTLWSRPCPAAPGVWF